MRDARRSTLRWSAGPGAGATPGLELQRKLSRATGHVFEIALMLLECQGCLLPQKSSWGFDPDTSRQVEVSGMSSVARRPAAGTPPHCDTRFRPPRRAAGARLASSS
jgi:hypothetical protein